MAGGSPRELSGLEDSSSHPSEIVRWAGGVSSPDNNTGGGTLAAPEVQLQSCQGKDSRSCMSRTLLLVWPKKEVGFVL